MRGLCRRRNLPRWPRFLRLLTREKSWSQIRIYQPLPGDVLRAPVSFWKGGNTWIIFIALGSVKAWQDFYFSLFFCPNSWISKLTARRDESDQKVVCGGMAKRSKNFTFSDELCVWKREQGKEHIKPSMKNMYFVIVILLILLLLFFSSTTPSTTASFTEEIFLYIMR